MLEGTFAVTFITPLGEDGGFVILEDGKVVGGDSNYIYDGAYYKKDEKMQARLLLNNYTGRATSIFGKTKYCWMKVTYVEDEDGAGFKGEGLVVDILPDMPGIVGAKVGIVGRRLT